MDETKLEKLAETIRKLWVEERRYFDLKTTGKASNWGNSHMTKWDGGMSTDGKMHQSVWPKIASFCEANNLNPVTLVRSMFHGCYNYPPYPNQACGAYALEKYGAYVGAATQIEIKNKILNDFESNKSQISAFVFSKKKYMNWPEDRAYRVAITSKYEPYSPLFRYCIAVNQGWNDLAELFKTAAVLQYKQHPETYDEVWKEWIPSGLQQVCNQSENRS